MKLTPETISALAQVMSANGLSKLCYEEGDSKLHLEANAPTPIFAAPVPTQATMPAAVVAAQSAPAVQTPAAPSIPAGVTPVKSPLVGVFYAAPAPDAEPFVSVGSRVKQGDVLCLIEAMKLMNEITAECDGEVAEICIKNGEIAEYGQVLFHIR